jgi:hypothetical protein
MHPNAMAHNVKNEFRSPTKADHEYIVPTNVAKRRIVTDVTQEYSDSSIASPCTA